MRRPLERWRPVVGWEGIYEVSSLGRVRKSNYILAVTLSHKGYPTVGLGSRPVRRTIHSLVAEAFIGPRPSGYHIDHWNGVRADNRSSNLEYVTPEENARRSRERVGWWGLEGEEHPHAKLTEKEVRLIRRLREAGASQSSIAARFDVTQANISEIVRYRTWRHVI